MKKNCMTNLLILLLLVQVLGGDVTAQPNVGQTSNPVESALDGLLNGVRSFADSIGNMFAGFKP